MIEKEENENLSDCCNAPMLKGSGQCTNCGALGRYEDEDEEEEETEEEEEDDEIDEEHYG